MGGKIPGANAPGRGDHGVGLPLRAFQVALLQRDPDLPGGPLLEFQESGQHPVQEFFFSRKTGQGFLPGDPRQIAGLGEGADDYMGKPFSILELQARVQNLLRRARRQTPAQSGTTTHGPFSIQWSHMRVTRDGLALDLTPQEFRIMTLLIRAEGKPLDRTELLTLAWPSNSRPASPHTVDVYVARLRSKLTRSADAPWILTHGGKGYSWGG